MGWLEKVTGISFKTKGSAPGKAVIIQTVAAGDQERTAEMYHPPGESSAPTKNDRVISIPVGTGTRVIIASHNYRIEVDVDSGEKIIYSTDSTGETIKSTIKLDNAGNIDLNGDTKKFVTHTELNTALQLFITALNINIGTKLDGAGTPGANSLDISAAATTTIRTGG